MLLPWCTVRPQTESHSPVFRTETSQMESKPSYLLRGLPWVSCYSERKLISTYPFTDDLERRLGEEVSAGHSESRRMQGGGSGRMGEVGGGAGRDTHTWGLFFTLLEMGLWRENYRSLATKKSLNNQSIDRVPSSCAPCRGSGLFLWAAWTCGFRLLRQTLHCEMVMF